jgi:FlaA1/EpsC-like NDP-sugar epimerase
MTRYFMTIPEAVQLVVQAGAIGGRGQVYVLDMGEPVRIVDLAEKMIRLSGKEPGRDVVIAFIGPKKGEKLHEVLVGDGETVSPTSHEAILLLTRSPVEATWLEQELSELEHLVDEGDTLEVSATLNRMVSEPRRAVVPAPPAVAAAAD